MTWEYVFTFLFYLYTGINRIYMISHVVSPRPVLPLMLCNNTYTHICSHWWERWFLGDIDFLSFLFILCYIVYLPCLMLIIVDNWPGPLPFTCAIIYSVHLMGFIMSQKIWPLSCLHISTSIDANICVFIFISPDINMGFSFLFSLILFHL